MPALRFSTCRTLGISGPVALKPPPRQRLTPVDAMIAMITTNAINTREMEISLSLFIRPPFDCFDYSHLRTDDL
jgi:hypothetical protein